jgi:hypothetical protein
MPANTVIPVAERTSAPAPCESTNGTVPAMNATEVITIGRWRSRQASSNYPSTGIEPIYPVQPPGQQECLRETVDLLLKKYKLLQPKRKP